MRRPLQAVLFVVLTAMGVSAQTPGGVLSQQKISSLAGGFTGTLDAVDAFGSAVAPLTDLDGDGLPDLAVGALGDDDGGPFSAGTGRGAVWILFLAADGTVRAHQKISSTAGGFGVLLDDDDRFGWAMTALGDLDGDGVQDLAVGARGDDDGGLNRGAVWILFLRTDGTVKASQKISATAGGFTGALSNLDEFGSGLAWLGDLDGDGTGDLAVGALGDDDGGPDRGAVWILFLDTDGTVKSHAKISATTGGVTPTLADGDHFGVSAAFLGDLDGDGVGDLAVGARLDDTGGPDRGAVWILFLDPDGSVQATHKIADATGGFDDPLDDIEQLGTSLAGLGDHDGDGVPDLAAGANHNNDGGTKQGAVRILYLDTDGTVRRTTRISETSGGFTGLLDPFDEFGISLAFLGDLDGDGRGDLAAGALWDDDGPASEHGAAWVLFLDAAHWEDLGHALGGSLGEPTLTGSGSLVEGDPVELLVAGSLPATTAYFVVGFSALEFSPFYGGTLVPDFNPPGFFMILATDAGGGLTLTAPWPAGVPADLSFWFQCWIVDAGGPFGFAATNALRATTP